MQSGGMAPGSIGGRARIIKRHREGEYGTPVDASEDFSRLHTPVLLQESVDALQIHRVAAVAVVVDATLGEGGHTREILKRLPERREGLPVVIGIERDRRMLSALTLSDPRLVAVEGNFRETARILKSLGHERAHAVLADIGLSGRHYRTPEWGFSFADGPLDMRMGSEGTTAKEIVNEWSEERLANLLLAAGERHGRKIARGIVAARKKKRLSRTTELAELAAMIVGRRSRSHPATKVFRALREAVTGELADLAGFIPDAAGVLEAGGRCAILTYTWEEERIVRAQADALVKGCICPPDFPVCACGRKPILRWVSRKGIGPTEGEVNQNPSARSAKLLVVERL